MTIVGSQNVISLTVKVQKLAGLALSVALTNTTTDSDCQTPSGQIPGDEPEQGIYD